MSGRVLYRGGRVWSPSHPAATAILVDGPRVLWVGASGGAPVEDGDQVVELDGALVAPAFVDAHVHLTETGLALTGVDLTGAASLAQALQRVEQAARRGGGRPILGHGWDEARWPERRPPTRAELDRAAYGGAVYLSRVDVHSAVVSSALAAAAGLRELEGWNDDGRVERAAHHAARDATRAHLSPAARQELQRNALRAAAAAGIGAVHEMSAPHIGTDEDLRTLHDLARVEPLPQVLAYRGELVGDEQGARAVVERVGVPLRGLAGDLCADGSIGSRTAALREPYADAPGARGRAYLSATQVREHVVACTRFGLQAGFHVIGDAACDAVVEGLRQAAEVLGEQPMRRAGHRLEHVEMLDDAGVQVLARLGVRASVQPAFDARWGGASGLYAARLGNARAAGMNSFAAQSAAGVPLALGSDSPVTPFDPWGAVAACAAHHEPAQRIGVREAFLAHTVGGWRLGGADVADGLGTLVSGAPATFAVWASSDPSESAGATDPAQVRGLPDLSGTTSRPQCLRTVVRGVQVHDLGALHAHGQA